MDETQSLDSCVLDSEDIMASIETESNASREDTVAKLEQTLRRNLKLDEDDDESLSSRNGHYEISGDRLSVSVFKLFTVITDKTPLDIVF